ncbi:MAG: HAMP domain-containing sensor histidine kinase [Nitriliruptorales bacterium]|nr:HAMP domain-containing sensor histidine kinase [Nitriliruptorales bacterium]
MSDQDRIHDLEETLSLLRHELTTPLTVIETALDALEKQRDRLPADSRELVGAGRRQLRVAQAIVDDLHVAGQDELTLDLERVDLGELVSEYVDDLDRVFVDGHEIVLRVPDEEVPLTVDVTRIRQLLRNLLDNADKYSPDDEPIHVDVVTEDDAALLWITDSGDGVAPEDAERIFEHYVTGDHARSGLGLGLAISRRIAQAHAGGLAVTDAPNGSGARFVLELPLTASGVQSTD